MFVDRFEQEQCCKQWVALLRAEVGGLETGNTSRIEAVKAETEDAKAPGVKEEVMVRRDASMQ